MRAKERVEMICKHPAVLGIVVGLLAMFATLTMANVLTHASAIAPGDGNRLTVDGIDLTPGTAHPINYSSSESCEGGSNFPGLWSSTPTYARTAQSVSAPELVSIVVTPANGSIVKDAAQQFTATGPFSDTSAQNVTLPVSGGIDSNATTNGACNAPASSCTTYATSAPARKETIMIIAWWAGQSLTATASDGGVNTYSPIVGPTNVPNTLIKTEVWYAVNRGGPMGFTVTLSGNSTPGAFDGIFIQVVSMTGLDQINPLDSATVRTNTGTGAVLSVTPGTPAVANEMIWGIFLCPSPATPWTPGSGWKSVSGQEAVSQSIYQNTSSGPIQTPKVKAFVSVNWIGFAIGFR
jgi:hypothetical protein